MGRAVGPPVSLTLRLLAGILILSLFTPTTFSQPERLSSRTELLALYSLRSSLGLRARDWPRAADPCQVWTGVTCESGRVTGLDLAGLKRTRLGRLSPSFSVDGLQELTLLTRFNGSGFELPGPIPDWFGARLNPGFSVLDLSGSGVTGQIPDSLGNLSSLTVLDLSVNKLKGPIPVSLGNLTEVKTLNLSHNGLSGSIPDPLWSLSHLTQLDLSSNGLIGELPSISPTIGSKSTVSLSNNLYYGTIPLDFTEFFSRVGSVDLTGNYFDGGAPIGSRAKGGSIAISKNCFLNSDDQRSASDCMSFYSAREAQYDGPTLSPAQHKKSRDNLKYILLAATGGGLLLVLLAVLALYFLCCRTRRRRRNSDSVLPRHQRPGQQQRQTRQSTGEAVASSAGAHASDSRQDSVTAGAGTEAESPAVQTAVNHSQVGEPFTNGRLRRATSDFSEENLIHRGHTGDLYRGQLDDGTRVAVKRMGQHVVNRDAYLAAELALFAKGTHERLVELLGCCLDAPGGVKLLVYRLVEHGDLASVLHRIPREDEEEEEVQALDWIKRLKIAAGLAQALCYLHHECDPPIVHRDVQASSVLIDDNYEVKLGSLSENCEQEAEKNVGAVAPTPGVISRFLKFTSSSSSSSAEPTNPTLPQAASCTNDTYSLGFVLLELVTGQSPRATSASAYLDRLLPSIDITNKSALLKIVDPKLIVDEDHLEEVWAVAVVAKSCVGPRPNKRPTMAHVVRALENPTKVVREDSFEKMRATSARGSWNAAFWASRRFEETRGATGLGGGSNSGGSNRRASSGVFPEPDLEGIVIE